MNVLDLFSGCGGISLGFKLAGFNISGGIDIDPDSVKTFRKTFQNQKLFVKAYWNIVTKKF